MVQWCVWAGPVLCSSPRPGETAGSCFRIYAAAAGVQGSRGDQEGLCWCTTLSAVCVPHPVLLCACREKRLREWKQEKVRFFSQHSWLADADTAARTTASQTGGGADGPVHAVASTGNSSSSSSNASVASQGHHDDRQQHTCPTCLVLRRSCVCLLVCCVCPLPSPLQAKQDLQEKIAKYDPNNDAVVEVRAAATSRQQCLSRVVLCRRFALMAHGCCNDSGSPLGV